MIGVLVFANWGKPLEGDHGLWSLIYQYKWWIAGFSLLSLAVILFRWFKKDELKEWTSATWGFALQILPLLLGGVLVSGFLLGRVGHEGIIPNRWVEWAVGGNSLRANLLSSVVAAFMYFATLTEVPILQGLIGAGMGKGPALALLLAGPALISAEYAGASFDYGDTKDRRLRFTCYYYVDDYRDVFRRILLMEMIE